MAAASVMPWRVAQPLQVAGLEHAGDGLRAEAGLAEARALLAG